MGVLGNIFGGSGQFGSGPTAVTAQGLTNEGFELTQPFIQDVLEASRAQFFEDVEDPDTGDTVQQLRAFDQFTGPRLADFAPEQQEAFTGLAALGREGLASTDLGRSPQFFQQAKEKAGLGSLGFTEADANRLMNPYLRGPIDIAKREAVRQFESTVQPKLRAEAVRAGQFGGSRAAILEAEAQRNLQQQLSDIEERGLATAFEQAQRAFEAEKARELQSSGLFASLGEAVPAQAARELALLSSVGEAQQAQEQAALNLAERDFIEQREFPLRQLQEFQSLVRGFPFTPSTYQVTTQQTPQPSFGQQLLGTLGTGVGIFGALGGFKNKAGGQVVPRQSGGQIRGGLASLERHQNNDILRQRPRLPDGSFYPARGAIGRGAANPMGGGDRRSFIDVITSIFNRPPSVQQANMASIKANQPRFSGQRASDLPPVVRVAEAAPGSLRETSALVEALQPTKPKEESKNILDIIAKGQSDLNFARSLPTQITSKATKFLADRGDNLSGYGDDLSEYNNLLEEQFRRQQTAEDLERIREAQRNAGVAGDIRRLPTIEERRRGEKLPEFSDDNVQDMFLPKESKDDPASRSYSKAEVKLDMEEMETKALARKAGEEKAAVAAAKEGGGDGGILDANENKNLQDGKEEFSSAYDTLDKAFDDYLSFLEKKKGETDVEMAEAQEAREMRLFAELAATSARFAGQAGPGGFLAKLNQAALPSIAELKDIQSDFRKEMKAAKDIEQDVLKEGLNINLARAKLNIRRSELESQNRLRKAKAEAEGVVGGLDANEGANFVAKVSEGLTKLDPRGATMVGERYLSNLGEGMTPRAAARNALDYADTLSRNPSLTSGTGGGPRKTAGETVDEAARRNIEKVRGAGRTPVNREEPK